MTAVIQTSAVTETTSDQTAHVATEPAGIVDGDLLLARFVTDGSVTHTAPAGWTEVVNDYGTAHTSSWWRKAASGESGTYEFTSGTAQQSVVIILRIDGHNAASPIDVQGTAEGTSNTPICPDVTTTQDDVLLLRGMGADGQVTDEDGGEPADHTLVFSKLTGGASGCGGGVASRTWASAGAVGTADWSMLGSDQWTAESIGIAPASGGGGGGSYADFKIGAADIMTNQPSEIRFIPAQPTTHRLSGGGFVLSTRNKGGRLVVRWGMGAAKAGAYDELITDLGGTPGTLASITYKHTITWEDPNGNTFSIDTVCEDVQVVYGPGQFYMPFTVTFWETPG